MLLSPRYDGPPIISIAGSLDDQLAPVTRQRRRMEAMIAGLSDDDWSAASRCAEWSVHDVVAHIEGVNRFWHASVVAGLAGEPTRILAAFDPAATPPLMVAPMRALSTAKVLKRFVASNDAFLGALADLDDAGWAMRAESPAGHVPIRLLASHALWDSWIHERDIALPLGLVPAVEADEVGSSLRYAAALGPALAMGFAHVPAECLAIEATDPGLAIVLDVGESVSVRDVAVPSTAPCLRGDAVELLEALSLRVPLPSTSPSEWRTLSQGLAAAFSTP